MGIYLGGIYRKRNCLSARSDRLFPCRARLSRDLPCPAPTAFCRSAAPRPLSPEPQRSKWHAPHAARSLCRLCPGTRSARLSCFVPSGKCSFLIRSNFHHEYFHTEQLCQMLGVSRSTLYRAFQSELNISPGEFYRISAFIRHVVCSSSAIPSKQLLSPAASRILFTSPGHSTDVWASHRQITAGSRKKQDAGSEYSRLVF